MVFNRFKNQKIIYLLARRIILLSLMSFVVIGCNYEKNKTHSEESESLRHIEGLTFKEVQQTVFFPRCQSCHQNSGVFTFSDYNTVHNNIQNIEQRVFTFGDMPQDAPLSANQKSILRSWIDEGGAP